MSIHTVMLATLIAVFGVAQYALCIQAIRDLARRPRVRGDNKVLWALLIVCIPIFGAIIYNWMGPTSFVGRRTSSHPSAPSSLYRSTPVVTPITTSTGNRHRAVRTPSPSTPHEMHRPHRGGRTGS